MIGTKIKESSKSESKVILIDADSLLYSAAYGTEEDQLISEMKLSEYLYEILSDIELRYNIERYYIFIRGNNNFRKSLYPEYKANRTEKHKIIPSLGQFLVDKEQFKAIECHNAEADDCVYSYAEEYKDQAIICSIDKDLLQIPGLHYNYKTKTYKEISIEEARHNLASQMIIGDAGDNINLTPKFGKAYAKKHLRKGMSDFQYIKEIYKVFLMCWKNNRIAKEKCRLAYSLLKLKIIKN